MNEETNLPEGLQLAVKLLAQIGDDKSDRAISAVHAACDLAQRVAELEKERDEWRRLASACSPAKELAASLKQAKASGDAARKERDELRARLAELGRQEPVATAWITGGRMVNAFNHPPRSDFDRDGRWAEIGYSQAPLYARPVPATPEGWKLVPVEATEAMLDAEAGACGPAWGATIAAAPEHKA